MPGPAVPRTAALIALGAVVVAATTLLSVAAAVGTATATAPVAGAAGQVVVFAGAAVLLRRRAAGSLAEAGLWRWLSRALAALAVGAVVKVAARLATGGTGSEVELLAAGTATVVAAPLLYRGLILWNRVGTTTSDPEDWLNGLGGGLAIAGVLDLVVARWQPGWEAWPWWLEQVATLQLGALLLLLGTVLTVAVLSDLRLDPRSWLAGLATTVLIVLTGADVVVHDGAPAGDLAAGGWVLVAGGLALAAVLRAQAALPQASKVQDLAVGCLVVLTGGVVIIALATRLDPALTGPVVVLGLLAAAAACVNLMRLVGDLDHLATTRQEARTDDLTQLANRRSLLAALEAALERGAGLALLVVDLDRFKEVNDRFGHAAGDDLLRWCARLLQDAAPDGSTAARLGGDEFALLLPGCGLAEAQVVARRGRRPGRPPRPGGGAPRPRRRQRGHRGHRHRLRHRRGVGLGAAAPGGHRDVPGEGARDARRRVRRRGRPGAPGSAPCSPRSWRTRWAGPRRRGARSSSSCTTSRSCRWTRAKWSAPRRSCGGSTRGWA